MAKFEIIVRETRILKYKIDAPTEQIATDRVITDSSVLPLPYQTQRLSRELYTVVIPEVKATPDLWDVTHLNASNVSSGAISGLTPHPSVEIVDTKVYPYPAQIKKAKTKAKKAKSKVKSKR